MKLFKTNNIDVVKSCQLFFDVSLTEWHKTYFFFTEPCRSILTYLLT